MPSRPGSAPVPLFGPPTRRQCESTVTLALPKRVCRAIRPRRHMTSPTSSGGPCVCHQTSRLANGSISSLRRTSAVPRRRPRRNPLDEQRERDRDTGPAEMARTGAPLGIHRDQRAHQGPLARPARLPRGRRRRSAPARTRSGPAFRRAASPRRAPVARALDRATVGSSGPVRSVSRATSAVADSPVRSARSPPDPTVCPYRLGRHALRMSRARRTGCPEGRSAVFASASVALAQCQILGLTAQSLRIVPAHEVAKASRSDLPHLAGGSAKEDVGALPRDASARSDRTRAARTDLASRSPSGASARSAGPGPRCSTVPTSVQPSRTGGSPSSSTWT